MQSNWPESMATEAAGSTIMFSYIGESNIRSMFIGLSGALFLVSLVLLYSLGSVKLSLVAIVASILPVTISFGIWGYLNGNIDLGMSIVLAISLGIVIDDAVHILHRFNHIFRENGSDVAAALHETIDSVGRAVLLTTLVICAGFFVLTFSLSALTVNMAAFTILTVAAAYVVDVLLIPSILVMLYSRKDSVE
jgi:predicted RND superfamily exporter protein